MQVQLQPRRLGGVGPQPISSGSRILVVSRAKRKGVSKELQELQQLKDSPPPAPAPPSAAAAPAPPPPTASASASPPPPATSPAATTTSNAATSSSSSSSSGGGGSGLFDSLLFRILASVTAIMMVIGIFYSIVFYGASNAVYIFKDQLSAITKKDFVPYSERRRMEQEVLAKLEAELAEKQRARDGYGAASEGGSSSSNSSSSSGPEAQAPVVAPEEDAGSSVELLNLLPASKKP